MDEEINNKGRPLSTEASLLMGFSFNSRLAKNLDLWRNAVLNQDIDFVCLVDGVEGSGKSVLGLQVAKYLDVDREINIDNQVCYYPEQVKEAIMSLKPGKAIVWDEARRGLNRRRSTDRVNIKMTDLLAECRQHNLFLVVIMPSFFDMDMNIAVWRSRCLIHTWYDWDLNNKDKPLMRGFFRFYSEQGKKALYCNRILRQGYRYPYLKNNSFDATFVNHYVVDEAVYRKKKREAEEFFRNEKNNKGLASVCPICNSTNLRVRVSDGICVCRRCSHKWVPPKHDDTNI